MSADGLKLLIGGNHAEQLSTEQKTALEVKVLKHRLEKLRDEKTKLAARCKDLQTQLDATEKSCAELSYQNANLEGRLCISSQTTDSLLQLLGNSSETLTLTQRPCFWGAYL